MESPNSPSSRISRTISAGTSSSSATFSSSGRSRSATKRRTVSMRASKVSGSSDIAPPCPLSRERKEAGVRGFGKASSRRKKTLTLPSPASGRGNNSVALHPRQRVRMISGVAEQLVQHAVALHVEADIIFVGHADAAVHLHALLHRQRRRSAGLRLGDRDHCLGIRAALVEQLLRLERRGAGDLQLGIEVGGAMLEGLELADEPPELLALLEIIDGHRHRCGTDADQLRSGAGAAGIEHAAEDGLTLPDLA